MQKRLFFLLTLLLTLAVSVSAQVTTSGIQGKVTAEGDVVIGATVTAKHEPSGTIYRGVTNIDGRYSIQGMRVGGPYSVTISYIGYQNKVYQGVQLHLGETEDLSGTLTADTKQLDEVVVTGAAGINATKTGAAMSIGADQINDMPTVNHSIADIARMNPQISTNEQNGSMSFAGMNNRYNSFQIDGVMNNDVFGLTSNGSNGGQASTQPVSMETIDQIQVNIAPFDVRQSGFTGGAINATTKSGTNQFHGSAYIYGNNQELVGRHYKNPDGTYASPYSKEKEMIFGFTLGGPIIKDKLFFFASYENANKSYPNDYGLGSEGSKVNAETATEILNDVKQIAQKQGYSYDTYYANPDMETWSNKANVKLDWNINDFNKFTVRWSYVNARSMKGGGGIATLNTMDHLYKFCSNTNTFAAELQSRLSPTLSNELRANYVRVRDRRTSGSPAPSITIYNVKKTLDDGTVTTGTINIGNEYSSMANSLDQDNYSFEDNLTWYKGSHTFTFGTHNEYYKFKNLFLQNLYGCYYFNSTDDFFSYYNGYMNGETGLGKYINQYYYSQANEEVTGDPRWASSASFAQLGFYAQDKWQASNNFTLTYGLRVDIPMLLDTPSENKEFNEWAAAKGYSYRTNQKFKSTPLWSPRVGFRWDINSDRQFILRGGVGVFTGRIPFVWVLNNFQNTGVQTSSYTARKNADLDLIMDPDKQTDNANKLSASTGSQTVNVMDRNFKFAQSLRVNLGFDFKLLGIDWTAEAIYTKTLNDIYYKNIAYEETGKTLADETGNTWDNRPMYQRATTGTPFNNIYVMDNTSKGYSYNLSLKAEKHFNFGLDLMASYTFTQSKSVSSVTSSVAQSNWRNTQTYRRSNDPELGNSAYNIPHIVKASAFYHFNWGPKKLFTTTVGLIYEGKSGAPYALTYNGDINGDGGTSNDLFYIPTDEQIDQMNFLATSDCSAEQQRADLKAWLGKTAYLKDHRGQYYKRYADNLPFESRFDLHVAQKFGIKVGSYVHALEISLDIMNVANLLNKDWGSTLNDGYSSVFASPVTYSDGQYQYLKGADYVMQYPSNYYSRWRGQIGVKYTF